MAPFTYCAVYFTTTLKSNKKKKKHFIYRHQPKKAFGIKLKNCRFEENRCIEVCAWVRAIQWKTTEIYSQYYFQLSLRSKCAAPSLSAFLQKVLSTKDLQILQDDALPQGMRNHLMHASLCLRQSRSAPPSGMSSGLEVVFCEPTNPK